MNTTITTPFPLLEDLDQTRVKNRIASRLRNLPDFGARDQQSSVCLTKEMIEGMFISEALPAAAPLAAAPPLTGGTALIAGTALTGGTLPAALSWADALVRFCPTALSTPTVLSTPIALSKAEKETHEICNAVVVFHFLALLAEANDELTRPILPRGQPLQQPHDLRCGHWLIHSPINQKRCQHSASPVQQPADDERPQPQFVWSKELYKARKAAQEFSKETHADY